MPTKIERENEQFAREKIIEYCQFIPTNIIYEPNGFSKAPDYEIYIKEKARTKRINLEITTVYGWKLNSDGRSIRKRSAVDLFQGFNKALQKKARYWIKKGEWFFVSFRSCLQVKKSSKIPLYKLVAPLNKELQRLDIDNKIPINPPIDSGYDFSIFIKGEEFQFSIYKVIDEISWQVSNSIKVVSAVDSVDPLFDTSLLSQALINLQSSLREKEKKLSKIEGEKWIGIINEHPCLNKNLYQNAYHQLIVEHKFLHSFSRVFIILGSEVLELTSLG